MASEAIINDLRLSCIWVETMLDLLTSDDPASYNAPLACLGSRDGYLQMWDEVLQGRGPAGLKPPWLESAGQHFWRYYLDNKAAASVTARQAWDGVVPLRRLLPAEVKAPWLPGRLTAEAFFYPHGVAFLLTATCRGDFSLDEAIGHAFAVRKDQRFDVRWDGGAAESLTLDALADKALTVLRQGWLGQATAAGARSRSPFTALTVVRGDKVPPSEAIPEGGDVHLALEAWTGWSPTYRENALPALAERRRALSQTAPASHVLYQHARGLGVWFPALFTRGTTKRNHPLACYHRNLVFTSLQIESLGGLIAQTAQQLRAGARPARQDHSQCVKRAVTMLSLLYGGSEHAYRSPSAQAHLKLNGLLPDLNAVRDFFDLRPL